MSASRQSSIHAASDGPQPLIGIVEDDPIMGESLVQRLRLEGYSTCWWQSGEDALAYLRRASCHVLVCDIRLPDVSGEQLFRRALPTLGTTPVIFITAFGEVEQAVRLMQAGANDYITKPFEVDALLGKIALYCAKELAAGSDAPGRQALSGSPAMRRLQGELLAVVDKPDPVLLLGETGVGKEVAALLQGKFLRLLEDRRYNRLGGTQETISEARIVSSSNADLPALIEEGRFRVDLYYRLNATELRIPPLRARREDIVSLAEHFIAQFSRIAGHRIPSLTPAAVTALLDYGWPGNVRELRHRIQRALDLAAAAPQVSAHMLFPERSLLEEPRDRVGTLAEARERAERLHIEEAIR